MNAKLKKVALALGTLAILGAASQASAFPQFYIQPGAVNPLDTVNNPGSPAPGGLGPLDRFLGSASERLLATSATTFSGNGLLTISGFFNGAAQKYVPGISGAAPYQMYITFALTDTLTGGTFGQPGSTYSISQLDFKIWADPLNNDDFGTYGTATSTTDPTAGTAAQTADDIVLAYGSLLAGNAVVNNGGGSTGGALNSTQSLALCSGVGTAVSGNNTIVGGSAAAAGCASAAGKNFFYFPSPFYALAFDAFNNTSAVFTNGALVLSGGVGTVNFVTVPEPSTVALFGIAALGLGLSSRRRKSA